MEKIKQKIRGVLLCFLSQISPRLNYKYRFWRIYGKKLNLRQPKTFNEKIIWLELNRYQKDPKVIRCCDKYAVREYVVERGCGDTLVKQIGSWEKASQIPWETLPERFVLKWNFGAGFNLICPDKSRVDVKQAETQLDVWEKKKYWLWYGEMHYKYVPRRIVCEEYISALAEVGSSSPDDYKFYCFHGKVKYILVCANRKGMRANYMFFDTEWELQPFSRYAVENKGKIKRKRPKMLDKAIEYSERLAADFPFVRVDWYLTDDHIYFGEMTFTPCGGMDDDLLEGDQKMGEILSLPQ